MCLISSDKFLKDQQRKCYTLAPRLTFLRVECGFAKIKKKKKGSIKAKLYLVVILQNLAGGLPQTCPQPDKSIDEWV